LTKKKDHRYGYRWQLRERLLKAGRRFFDDKNGPANIALETNLKIEKKDVDQFGDDFMFELTKEEYDSLRY